MSEKSQELTLWGHLNELRNRLLYSTAALVVGVVVSLVFGDTLLEWVARPIGGLENLL